MDDQNNPGGSQPADQGGQAPATEPSQPAPEPNVDTGGPQTPPAGGEQMLSEKCVTCGSSASGGTCTACGQGEVTCTCQPTAGGGTPPGGEQPSAPAV